MAGCSPRFAQERGARLKRRQRSFLQLGLPPGRCEIGGRIHKKLGRADHPISALLVWIGGSCTAAVAFIRRWRVAHPSGHLRQEEFLCQRGPILVGNLRGQVVHGHAAVLRECSERHRHAPLQAARGLLGPPAGQRASAPPNRLRKLVLASGDCTVTSQPSP